MNDSAVKELAETIVAAIATMSIIVVSNLFKIYILEPVILFMVWVAVIKLTSIQNKINKL